MTCSTTPNSPGGEWSSSVLDPDPERTVMPAPAPSRYPEEGAFVQRLKARDASAFARLVADCGPRMLATVRRYLPMDSDADDALQDAFLSVWRSVGTFTGESRLTTWLHRIAVNAALLRIRTRSRRHEVLLGDALAEDRPDPTAHPTSVVGVGELLAQREVRQRIHACLAEIPEGVRAVVRLRDIEGLGLREIGVLLDLCQTTVKARLHRGRLALKARLASCIGAVA